VSSVTTIKIPHEPYDGRPILRHGTAVNVDCRPWRVFATDNEYAHLRPMGAEVAAGEAGHAEEDTERPVRGDRPAMGDL
jgi:hypothetical protein